MPGDKVKINIDSLIESLPMVAPNLNGYKASFDFYFCPWSNYYGWMDNNVRNNGAERVLSSRWVYAIGGSSELQTFEEVARTFDEKSVKPGSLLDYLGYPPGFMGTQADTDNGVTFYQIDVPAEKFLSVLDIYRNYYVNNQEGYAYFVSNDAFVRGGSSLLRVGLDELDKITIALRGGDSADDEYFLNLLSRIPATNHSAYPNVDNLGDLLRIIINCSFTSPLGGLPLRTYRMDLNRGVLKNSDDDFKSRVQISDGGFSIDTLRFANKMQKLLDRIDISGGRFSDMMRARWGVTPRNTLNVPDYLGSVSNFFGVTDVISTASGMNSEIDNGRGNSILGQQAGFAVGKVKRDNAPISFRSDQYGTLICMFSLVPIVTYSQGIELEDLKTSFSEVFDPAFNQLGFQDVRKEELMALPTFDFGESTDLQSQAYSGNLEDGIAYGRRFAWSEYMSSLPRAHGLFAYGQDFDYWVNNRIYVRPGVTAPVEDDEDPSSAINKILPYGNVNLSTYIDPSVQNNLFADVGLTAQNFRLRVNFDIWMRRNVGSRVMPHL